MKTFTFFILFIFSFPPYGFAADNRNPVCPQNRKTVKAPGKIYKMKIPIGSKQEILAGGKKLFQKSSKPLQCKICHGKNGNGLGDPDFESNPPARNFTCAATMKGISDGQLFWIIKNGSPGTSMMGYSHLSDSEIWKLVLYLREFSR